MMRRYYRYAGMEFAAVMEEALAPERDGRLEPFRVEAAEDPLVFHFRKVEKLDPPTGKLLAENGDLTVYEDARYFQRVGPTWDCAHFRVTGDRKRYDVQLRASAYPGRIPATAILDAFQTEHQIVSRAGVLFHCALVERKGKAILFTAPSQTGKSTQAELWRKHRGASVINGDRAALRMMNGTVLAEGVPFCGSSGCCENRSLPVEAIVYLAQAPRTTIRKLRGFEAFSRIWEGISVNTWNRKDLELASETVGRIAGAVPVYHMPCTPDGDAVAVLENTLNKEIQP